MNYNYYKIICYTYMLTQLFISVSGHILLETTDNLEGN